MVRIDNTTYCFAGLWCSTNNVSQLAPANVGYTATRSTFGFHAAGIFLNLTFTSPVYPNDLAKLARPAGYLEAKVSSADARAHHVQLYLDVTGQFAAGNQSQDLTWDFSSTKVLTHTFSTDQTFQETSDASNWGNWTLSTSAGHDVTHDTGGGSASVRSRFVSTGSLKNSIDSHPRPITSDWPVFAFARNLDLVRNTTSTVFSLGLWQLPSILYLDPSNKTVSLPPYWANQYSSAAEAAAGFTADYRSASKDMDQVDARIYHDAVAAGGPDYAAIAMLSYRQAYAGFELVGPKESPSAFLKEISSDGNVNTIDVLFPMLPIFVYDQSTELIRLILDPLILAQEAGQYPHPWAEHDIGAHYPCAVGHVDGNDEHMPVEESANMLLLLLAYARGHPVEAPAYVAQHYALFHRWAVYLIKYGLKPSGINSATTDDFLAATDNGTNLAIKAILGIAAMADLSKASGHLADADRFHHTARSYFSHWYSWSLTNSSFPHVRFTYGDPNSSALPYNLMPDSLLGLNIVPSSLYSTLSRYYSSPGAVQRYGVPVNSRTTWAKLDWNMWLASFLDSKCRGRIVEAVISWLRGTSSNVLLTDLYNSQSGSTSKSGLMFRNRPVVGGVFAPMAMKKK